MLKRHAIRILRQAGHTPDDQRFLMLRRARGLASAQLVIVENWFKEIKTKALR